MGRQLSRPVIADLMSRALEHPELLSIAAGFTDNAVLPRELVARAVSRLSERGMEYLQYGLNQGRLGLRRATAGFLRSYPDEAACVVDEDALLVTNGSQQCLYLAMQVLCDPGDLVLVERPSYFVFLEMLKGLGIEAEGLPSDAAGRLDFEGVRSLLRDLRARGAAQRLKAVYLVSYFSNPSSRCLPETDKIRLGELLAEEGFLIPLIEDGAYRDLYFEKPYPARTILSLDSLADFPRLFLGTYTKPLATGLKVGYGACTDAAWRGKMLSAKGHQDFGTSHFVQAVVEVILEEGWYEPFLKGEREHYAAKAEQMNAGLEAGGLRDLGWNWEKPQGGLLLWMEGPPGLDTRAGSPFCEACIARGVLYVPGDLCFTGGSPRHFVRLSYGALPDSKLSEATRRFVAVARDFS